MDLDQSGIVPDSQVVADMGSAELLLEGGEDQDLEVGAEIELPLLSLEERCGRLVEDQARLQRFNAACAEDDRR